MSSAWKSQVTNRFLFGLCKPFTVRFVILKIEDRSAHVCFNDVTKLNLENIFYSVAYFRWTSACKVGGYHGLWLCHLTLTPGCVSQDGETARLRLKSTTQTHHWDVWNQWPGTKRDLGLVVYSVNRHQCCSTEVQRNSRQLQHVKSGPYEAEQTVQSRYRRDEKSFWLMRCHNIE